jgi:hypothetical protein
MVQHIQIDKRKTAHKLNQGQKSYDRVNRCEKPLTKVLKKLGVEGT